MFSKDQLTHEIKGLEGFKRLGYLIELIKKMRIDRLERLKCLL